MLRCERADEKVGIRNRSSMHIPQTKTQTTDEGTDDTYGLREQDTGPAPDSRMFFLEQSWLLARIPKLAPPCKELRPMTGYGNSREAREGLIELR